MNTHTRRARTIAQRDYLAFVKNNNKGDLTAWMSNMQSRGLAVNTIRQRVSLVRRWLNVKEKVVLPIRCNMQEGKWLNPEQVRVILAVIPNNAKGRHDFALITALLITGLRLGQVRNWRWSDFQPNGRIASTNKGHFPRVAVEAVQAIGSSYQVSHFSNMHLPVAVAGEDYIFPAVHRQHRTAKHGCSPLHNSMKNQPLSPQEVNRRIKHYARLAGLEPRGISAESLRYTHKRLGENVIITLVQDSFENRNASPVQWKRVEHDNRLHGIGRRSHRK